MGELMKEAGLNTLLGMGMTFLVLIALSLIISLFGKILSSGLGRTKSAAAGMPAEKPGGEGPQKSLPGTEGLQEASGRAPAESPEDPELIAVLTAAVAAYEGAEVPPEVVAVLAAAVAAEGKAGAGGFEVRKIRKSRKRIA